LPKSQVLSSEWKTERVREYGSGDSEDSEELPCVIGESEGDCVWRGSRRSVGSSFHRQGAANRKERLVIFKEDRVGGWARVTTDQCFIQPLNTWGEIMKVGGHMASAKREPIMGIWGQSAQRGPGTEPLVGVRGKAPPPWSWKPCSLRASHGNGKLPHFLYFALSTHRPTMHIWCVSKTITVVKRATVCGISVYPPVCNTCTPCPND